MGKLRDIETKREENKYREGRGREGAREIDKNTNRQIDRQTDRQIDG